MHRRRSQNSSQIVNSLFTRAARLRQISPKSLIAISAGSLLLSGSLVTAASYTFTSSTPDGQIQTQTTIQVPEPTPAAGVDSGSVSTSVDSPNTKTSVTTQNGQTNVTINGQSITVPANGSVNKTIQTPGGNMSISINNSNAGSSSNQSSFSSTVHMHASSTSSGSSTFMSNNGGSFTITH